MGSAACRRARRKTQDEESRLGIYLKNEATRLSDVIAKRCMKAATADGISDAAALEEWSRQVEAQNWKRAVGEHADVTTANTAGGNS
jgi:hypothetical protein